jgi:response regulator of citrate/malate metabolism
VIGTLIVEDDVHVARIHAAHVSRLEAFEVVGQAHTLADARTAVDDLSPDLVLLDLYLPDGHGLDLVRALHERAERPDFMLITAARDLPTVREAMQLGAVHFLVKPFAFAALAERLMAYAELRGRLDRSAPEADQADVDALFGMLRATGVVPAPARKGHSPQTLELIRSTIRLASEPMSATDVATKLGISRPTAQRYLSYLAERGAIRLQLRYGVAGRPEHLYSRQ